MNRKIADKDIVKGLKYSDVIGNIQFKDNKRKRGRPRGSHNKVDKYFITRYMGITLKTYKPIKEEISNIIITQLNNSVNVKIVYKDGSFRYI